MFASNISVEEQSRRRKFRKGLFRWLCIFGMFFLIVWGASPFVKIGFNGTDSVDGYVFLIVKDVIPNKGELVAFWPPKNEFIQNIWFVKYMKGLSGDQVNRDGQHFYINNEYIGSAKTKSIDGIALRPSQAGVIPPGYFFVWTSHADSFDSRYESIGWIHQSRIIGSAYRIF